MESKAITLADGNEYKPSPITVGEYRRWAEAPTGSFDPSVQIIFDSLKKNHPELTLEHLRDDLLTFHNLGPALNLVMDVSGLKQEESKAEVKSEVASVGGSLPVPAVLQS